MSTAKIGSLTISVPQGGEETLYRMHRWAGPVNYRGECKGLSLAVARHEETMITLLLVDDEPMVLYGLRMWFERVADIMVVGEASNGAEAIALAQALHPDVVLMDISMPTIDGLAATEALSALVPRSVVVLHSLYDDVTMRARAYAAGAATLVGKHEGVKALLAAIREAGGRGRASPQE